MLRKNYVLVSCMLMIGFLSLKNLQFFSAHIPGAKSLLNDESFATSQTKAEDQGVKINFTAIPTEISLNDQLYTVDNRGKVELRCCESCSPACEEQILQESLTIFDALQIRLSIQRVANDSALCSGCAKNCSCQLVQPFEYDSAAPRVLRHKTFTSLSSIPEDRRILNFQRHVNATLGPLSMYNPSIIPIPESTKADLEGLTKSSPVYLASFRVTNVGACNLVPNFDYRMYGLNLVALVVLDSELEILHEIILDINKFMRRVDFEDYRLFVIQGVLYLSHCTKLLAIRVSRQGSASDALRLPSYLNHTTQMSVSILPKHHASFETKGFRSALFKMDLPKGGKNFQFFEEDGAVWIEKWPWHPHVVGHIDMTATRGPKLSNWTNLNSNRSINDLNDAFLVFHHASRQFTFTMERGSACCVKLEKKYLPAEYKHYEYVYVGISHSRTGPGMTPKAYLSRLFAFRPNWPFDMVARSGPFCLGSESSDLIPNYSQLQIQNKSYQCPMIHFVSGMTATKNETVMVAYGILDCLSRIVEFSLSDLVARLFTNMNTTQQVV